MFGKKIREAEVKRLIDHEILDVKLEIEKLKTHVNSLRGLINRKTRDKFDEEETEKPEKQNNKNEVLVPI